MAHGSSGGNKAEADGIHWVSGVTDRWRKYLADYAEQDVLLEDQFDLHVVENDNDPLEVKAHSDQERRKYLADYAI